MPLPPAIGTCTITGKFAIPPSGAADNGRVVFVGPALYDTSDHVILGAGAYVGELDGTGAFSVTVPVNDSSGVTPTGWSYQVVQTVLGGQTSFYTQVTSALGPTVQYDALVQAPVPSGPVFPQPWIPLAAVQAKGDMVSGSGAAMVTVTPVGTNGDVWTADSTATGGASWQIPATAPVTSVMGQTGAVTGLLQAASNLSDVGSAATSRTNLGLGNSATRAVGTTTGTVAAGDDSRITGALQSGAAAGGDLTGTYPNPTLAATANVESIIRANRLDQFAAPTGAVGMGSQKITGLANGTLASDAAAFGQIPTSLPPSGTAGGDLTGTYPNPTVTATANFKAQVETVRLDQMAAPTAAVGLNNQKITLLTNGSSASDAAAFGQIPVVATLSDITTATTRAAGATGRWADGAHVHGRDFFDGPDHGFLGWNFDPIACSSTGAAPGTAGQLQVVRFHVPYAQTITNLHIYVVTAGTSLTTGQNFIALFNAAQNLLSSSGDQTTAWGTTGAKVAALGAAQSVAAGDCFAGFYFNGTGTTPAFGRSSCGLSGLNNINLSGSSLRFATGISGNTTAMPSATGALTATNNGYWIGWS